MKILGIESSGLAASVACVEGELLKAEFTINNRMTHSETLLPMLEQMMRLLGEELASIDAVAVSAGPGSFTGLRIGAATAKGLGLALNKPLIKVSSLAALAYNLNACGTETVVCPMMDARRGQVYCAAYQAGLEIFPEQACSIRSFLEALNSLPEKETLEFVFLGDGVPVHADTIALELSGNFSFASAENSRQRAASVAVLGGLYYGKWLRTHGITAEEVRTNGADAVGCFDQIVMNSDDFVPEYLRKPQAEQELHSGLLEDPGQHSLKKIAKGDRHAARGRA